ncbi:MAG: hypothetical protein WD055_03345 [Candidatus Dependentiae bacterium]
MNKTVKVAIIALCLISGLSTNLSANTDITKKSAYELYGLIDSTKVAAFSTDSFTKNGLDPQELAKWQELVNQLNDHIKDSIRQNEAPNEYNQYIQTLQSSLELIKKVVNALQNNRPQAARYLHQIDKQLEELSHIEQQAYNTIIKQTKTPQQWLNKIPSDITKILTEPHKKILKEYTSLSSIQKKPTQKEVIGILRLNGIKQEDKNAKFKVSALLDNLDQYHYMLENNGKNLLKKSKQKDDLINQKQYSAALIHQLKEIYPNMLSSRDIQVFANTTNKPAMILFAQASAYSDILNQIKREITQ